MAIYLFFRLVVSFFITLCYRLRLRSLLGRLGHLLLLRSPQKVQLRFRLMTIWLMKIACWLKMIWKSPSYQLVRWIASNLLDFADFLQYIIGHWLNQFLFFFCSFSFSFFLLCKWSWWLWSRKYKESLQKLHMWQSWGRGESKVRTNNGSAEQSSISMWQRMFLVLFFKHCMNVLSCLAHGLSAEVSGVDLDLKKRKNKLSSRPWFCSLMV